MNVYSAGSLADAVTFLIMVLKAQGPENCVLFNREGCMFLFSRSHVPGILEACTDTQESNIFVKECRKEGTWNGKK